MYSRPNRTTGITCWFSFLNSTYDLLNAPLVFSKSRPGGRSYRM